MFKILMICAVIGLAAAAPVGSDDASATTLSRNEDVRADGFASDLETSNHITRSESGDEHGNIHGNFGWISPEGDNIEIAYVADENGYQPSGAVLPTPPPIPVQIQRALDWIAAHPSAPEH